MQKFLTWVFLIALILIHTADMEWTKYYIGNNYEHETFPPMSWCIAKFGIDKSLWISRLIMYPYFFMALVNQEKKWWFYFLILVTILYWASMLGWFFQLGFVEWPWPKETLPY